jgi:hypothetical protein
MGYAKLAPGPQDRGRGAGGAVSLSLAPGSYTAHPSGPGYVPTPVSFIVAKAKVQPLQLRSCPALAA